MASLQEFSFSFRIGSRCRVRVRYEGRTCKMAPIESSSTPDRNPLYWKWMWSTMKRPTLHTSRNDVMEYALNHFLLPSFAMPAAAKHLHISISHIDFRFSSLAIQYTLKVCYWLRYKIVGRLNEQSRMEVPLGCLNVESSRRNLQNCGSLISVWFGS